MTTTALKRVATYERVSSEDQRERETIKTQSEELAKRLATDPTVGKVTRYIDDGITGTIPMAERPQGRKLLEAAAAKDFDELWIYNVKRLGREAVDLLLLRRRLEPLGIRLFSLLEGEQTGLGYDVQAIIADHDRRQFLRLSSDGMNRAAREGRYTGGIVPLGYQVEGRKQTARLVPSDKIIWGDWTEAELVRKLYHWMAIDSWTCPRISRHLNALGVPTAYTKDERLVLRGQRKERTQGFWWPGRVRSIVTNPVYRGELQYGRRSTKPGGREVISASATPLVTLEMWEAAQVTLAANRIMSRNTDRVYLLKSVIRCGCCGRYYVGCWSRKYPRYRCNGQLTDRRPIQERCPSKTVKGPDLEPVVWDDIQHFLRNPGDILEQLEREREMDQGVVIAEAEMVTLEAALAELAQRRKKAIDLNLRNVIPDRELDEWLVQIYQEQEGVEERLRELQASLSEPEEPLNVDLLSELRRRLDEGLNERERQEIVQLLVKRITVYTEIKPEGKKAKVLIQYRFPGVVNVSTGTPALPFCHSTLTASRPPSPAYPSELKTLGDHLRKKRLDLGLLQREVAQQLEVDPMSISYWETNKYAPSLREIPKIIGFLGYVPYDTSIMTLEERILTLRRCLGLSREELAKKLGVDESTLRDWEHGRRKPLKSNLAKLDEVLGSLAGHISLQKPWARSCEVLYIHSVMDTPAISPFPRPIN